MRRTLELPPIPNAGAAPDGESARPSKTRMKQAMHDLQALGLALTELSDDRLAAVPMAESLRDAVMAYRRTRSHEGRRRQMQFIGKLMRQSDIEPIHEAVSAARLGLARDALALHTRERWRDDLIRHDTALDRWVQEHPDTDVQQLRSLIRMARKDAATTPEPAPGVAPRKGRAFRDLFRFLQQHPADPG